MSHRKSVDAPALRATAPSVSSIPHRVAMLSLHTSPLQQPGVGDAGGMNVYIAQTAQEMARRGILVEIFTRANSPEQPDVVELSPGVVVHHVRSGPLRSVGRQELFASTADFDAAVRRLVAQGTSSVGGAAPNGGSFDVVHSHYWLSGLVGRRISNRLRIPLVHTAHTLAKVKNQKLSGAETPETDNRTSSEEKIAADATLLVANTEQEAEQWKALYQANSARIRIAQPGVDLDAFLPGSAGTARLRLGISQNKKVIAFVGRLQPHKGPDLLLEAVAAMMARAPRWADELTILMVGGASGVGANQLVAARELAHALNLDQIVRFLPPQNGSSLRDIYLAADLVAMPSVTESFGLVALEAQACGTPVVASDVGGLRTSVANGFSGELVSSRDPQVWASRLVELLRGSDRLAKYARQARQYAQGFSWRRTTDSLLSAYGEAMELARYDFRSGVAM